MDISDLQRHSSRLFFNRFINYPNFRGLMINLLDNVALQLLGHSLPNATAAGWLWLTPISAEKASYSAPIVLFLAAIAGGISYRYLRRDPAMALRESETWDCGFGGLTQPANNGAKAINNNV
jgi:hypothetical protein